METIKHLFTETQMKAFNTYVKTKYLDCIGHIDQWDNSRNRRAYNDMMNAFNGPISKKINPKTILTLALNEASILLKKYNAKQKGFKPYMKDGLNISYRKNGVVFSSFFSNKLLKEMVYGNPEIFEMKFYLRYDAEVVAVTSYI